MIVVMSSIEKLPQHKSLNSASKHVVTIQVGHVIKLVSMYYLFALNLVFEFQTFIATENCAKSKVLATSPYAGSSVLYGDVVIFTMRRLSHDEKRSDNRKSFL